MDRLWSEARRDAMLHYNHVIGVKMVGEIDDPGYRLEDDIADVPARRGEP